MRQSPSPPLQDAGFFASLAKKLGREMQPVARHYSETSGISSLLVGDATPQFVMVHGARLHAHTFAALALQMEACSLALDMPGHGYSDPLPPEEYTLTRMAAAMTKQLRMLKHPVILVGHSLGGICAIAMAHQLPEKIRGLVLLDSCPAGAGRPAPAIIPFHEGSEETFLQALRQVYPDKSEGNLRQIIARDTIATPTGRRWLWDINYFQAADARMAEQDMIWQQLAALPMPVMLLSGGMSHAFGETDRQAVALRAPNVRQITLPLAGHNLHLDSAPAVAAALSTFEQELNKTHEA